MHPEINKTNEYEHEKRRWILAAGFGLLLVADIYLYFQYQTEGSFDHMVVVTIINYAGLFIPYAMLVPLGMKHLPCAT